MDIESKLLKLLRNAEGDISGEELSEKLGVTRSAVWKHVRSLRGAGYRVSAAPKKGYHFVSAPDRLLPDEIREHLGTRLLGRRIFCYETLDSTNRLALELGAKGSPEGTVVFAEEQTKGRGRLGRAWASPKGVGLYFSVILRPRMGIQEAPKITLAAAVAVAQALSGASGIEASIRWPNDLLVRGKKICGILTELSAEPDRVLHVVVGIGINVNTPARLLPPEGISLKTVTGKTWDRSRLAARVLESLEAAYAKLASGRFDELAAAWESRSAVSGKRIAASTLGGKLEGTALGIDSDGALWVRQDSGMQSKILSGDILFLR